MGMILKNLKIKMKVQICLLVLIHVLSANAFLFGGETWDDLKVTWSANPLGGFNSLPRTVNDAVYYGWKLEKSCGQVNGNRYILDNDRAVILVFDNLGNIAGIASSLPKGLPFNFPSAKQAEYMTDEGDSYTITGYFSDPESVCSRSTKRQSTGDRLVVKGDSKTLNIPIEETNVVEEGFFTKGGCFYTMGQHYWADLTGPLNANSKGEDFLPLFILYNKGVLNGFGWAFNADLPGPRYEHPTEDVLGSFFTDVPVGLSDPNQAGVLSTLHIYMDSTPLLNFC